MRVPYVALQLFSGELDSVVGAERYLHVEDQVEVLSPVFSSGRTPGSWIDWRTKSPHGSGNCLIRGSRMPHKPSIILSLPIMVHRAIKFLMHQIVWEPNPLLYELKIPKIQISTPTCFSLKIRSGSLYAIQYKEWFKTRINFSIVFNLFGYYIYTKQILFNKGLQMSHMLLIAKTGVLNSVW